MSALIQDASHEAAVLRAFDFGPTPPARGLGYWKGISWLKFAPWQPDDAPKTNQIILIRELMLHKDGTDDAAFWAPTFTSRAAMSVSNMLKTHCKSRFPYMSEVILEDRPCKMHVDIEFGKEVNPERDVVDDTLRLVVRTMEIIDEFFPGSRLEAIDLYALTPYKGSAHVTWQVVFENIRHVKAFVKQHIVPRIESNPEDLALFTVKKTKSKNDPMLIDVLALDLSVYRPGIFRMYGAEKQDRMNPLLPFGAKLGDALDLKTLSRALVGVVACNPADHVIVRANPILQHVFCTDQVWRVKNVEDILRKSPSNRTKRSKIDTKDDDDVITFPQADEAFRHVLRTCPTFSTMRLCPHAVEAHKDYGIPWGQVIIPSKNNPHAIVCPNKGAPHDSNCIYFHLNMVTGMGFFACPDEACMAAKENVFHRVSYREFFPPVNNDVPKAMKALNNNAVGQQVFDTFLKAKSPFKELLALGKIEMCPFTKTKNGQMIARAHIAPDALLSCPNAGAAHGAALFYLNLHTHQGYFLCQAEVCKLRSMVNYGLYV